MNFYPKNKIPEKEVRKFMIIFYTVGTLGFLLPFTKSFFIVITPFALLLNTYLLAIYHKDFSRKAIGVFILIFFAGFFIEVLGVNTGLIFGNYQYGSGLGIKLFNTPLLIGVNWLFLCYVSSSFIANLKLHRVLQYMLPPFVMLVYDLVLEQIAPKMDMWSWANDVVPLQNYIAWFFIALVFTSLIKQLKIDTKNHLTNVLLGGQFVFIVLLMLML